MQAILLLIVMFNSVIVPYVTCRLATKTRHWLWTSVQKIKLTEDTGGIFGEKLEKERTGHTTEKDGKQKARTKGMRAADRSRRLWRERRDHCGWTSLSQEDQPQRHHKTYQMSRKTSPTQSSIAGIIHCDAGPNCLFFFTKTPVSYYCVSYICVSQGSVATQLRCGGILKYNLVIANFLQCEKKICKIVQYLFNIWTIKTCQQTFVFGKYWPISKILSLAHSVDNFQWHHY